jgi:ribosomal-protein-alanine N-acetyltransferase
MFKKELELPQSICLVAERNGIAVGFGAAWIVGECLQILQVTVQKEVRRQGVGKGILAALEAEGKKKGCGRSELEYRDDNASALILYGKAGYLTVGKRKKFYGDADAVLMERTL